MGYTLNNDFIWFEKIKFPTIIVTDRDCGKKMAYDCSEYASNITGVAKATINKVCRDKSTSSIRRGNNDSKWSFKYGEIKEIEILNINFSSASKSENWSSVNKDLKCFDSEEAEKIKNNLRLVNLEVESVLSNGTVKIKCSNCNKLIEKKYKNIISCNRVLCKCCLQFIKSIKGVNRGKGKLKLLDIRSDILNEWTFDKNKNIEIPDINEVAAKSNKKIILTCKKCEKDSSFEISGLTRIRGKNFHNKMECNYCKSLRMVYPEIYKRIDFVKTLEREGLSKNEIDNLTYGSKKNIYIECYRCKKSHRVQILQLSRQNKDGIKLCEKCATLINTSFHAIYLIEVGLKLGHRLVIEESIFVGGKWLSIDIKDETINKCFEINGEHHIDKDNGFIKMAAKRNNITPEEQFQKQLENDENKKNEIINSNFEFQSYDINSISIKDMINDAYGLNIIELPNINFDKYTILEKAKNIQTLLDLDNSITALQIAKELYITETTVYNYIKKGIVKLPEGSKILYNNKPGDIECIQNNLDKNLTIKQIVEETGFSRSKIESFIRRGLCIPPSSSPIIKKTVVCLTTNELFSNTSAASKHYKIKNISQCFNGKKKYLGNHPDTGAPLIWIYREQYDLLSEEKRREIIEEVIFKYKVMNRKIVVLDENNQIIRTFDKITEVESEYNTNNKLITAACCGKSQKTHKVLFFKYLDRYLYDKGELIHNTDLKFII